MGGNTGNFITRRISATGGTRTIFSLLADGASAGAGGFRRAYGWYLYNGNGNTNASSGASASSLNLKMNEPVYQSRNQLNLFNK